MPKIIHILKINRILTVPYLYRKDLLDSSCYAQAVVNKQVRWCGEGESNPHGIAPTDFEFPAKTVNH